MSASSQLGKAPSYTQTAAHLRRVLVGFTPEFDKLGLEGQTYKVRVPPSCLPVAVIARQVMIMFGAAALAGRDKVAWQYGFTVDDVPCVLANTKWGLQLYLGTAAGNAKAADEMAQRTLTKLAAAQRVISKSVLAPQLSAQIDAGNVTITNQYATLRGGYEYFRDGANRAYAGDGRLVPAAGLADLIVGRGAIEGWWNTLAMVSAYFSTLEHVLIGCLPFTPFDPVTENLTWIIGARWNEKMKKAVPNRDAEAARQFAALHDIAARFRNTYSHGAFGPGGRAAMAVHVPGVGAVPASLHDFGVRPELLLVPAVKDDFDEICGVFDSCDEWLTTGPLSDGCRWVCAGLDFRFDSQFRAQASAAQSLGRLEELIIQTSEHIDDLINMDR